MQFEPHAVTNPYQKCPHQHGDESAQIQSPCGRWLGKYSEKKIQIQIYLAVYYSSTVIPNGRLPNGRFLKNILKASKILRIFIS